MSKFITRCALTPHQYFTKKAVLFSKKMYFCKTKTTFSDEKTDRLWQEINFIKKFEPLYKTDKNEEIEWVK